MGYEHVCSMMKKLFGGAPDRICPEGLGIRELSFTSAIYPGWRHSSRIPLYPDIRITGSWKHEKKLVHCDHDFAGLDDGICLFAWSKAECGNRLLGDDGGDLLSTGKLDNNLGVDAAGRDRFHCAFQDISCTDLHGSHQWELVMVSISTL